MKRHLPLAALLVLAFATLCFAQPQATASPSPSPAAKPKPRMSKAALLKKLSANETKLWEAWKNKDVKPFQMWLTADGVSVGEQGIGNKADLVKMLPSMPCDVTSFTLSDWKLSMADADAAVITYKGAAEGTCGGQPIPTVWASSLWVNRRGRWLAFSHQETPIKP
jgi:uncharacterized protein DUF4440